MAAKYDASLFSPELKDERPCLDLLLPVCSAKLSKENYQALKYWRQVLRKLSPSSSLTELLSVSNGICSLAFLDINPLSRGHALVIPKYHAEKLHELPDQYAADILPIAKKIAIAQGFENYNILQNNGRIAHQEVPHVHFHVIPKPTENDEEGLAIGWPAKSVDKGELSKHLEELKARLENPPESSL